MWNSLKTFHALDVQSDVCWQEGNVGYVVTGIHAFCGILDALFCGENVCWDGCGPGMLDSHVFLSVLMDVIRTACSRNAQLLVGAPIIREIIVLKSDHKSLSQMFQF